MIARACACARAYGCVCVMIHHLTFVVSRFIFHIGILGKVRFFHQKRIETRRDCQCTQSSSPRVGFCVCSIVFVRNVFGEDGRSQQSFVLCAPQSWSWPKEDAVSCLTGWGVGNGTCLKYEHIDSSHKHTVGNAFLRCAGMISPSINVLPLSYVP